MSSQELIEEIKHISNQYHAEVGRGKKAWPKSIKDRIVQLLETGMPATRISKLTAVPYFTVLKWRKTKGRPRGRSHGFKELTVLSDAPQKVAVTVTQKLDTQQVATVTVAQKLAVALGGQVQRPDISVPITTPDGFKIELPCMEAAIDFILKLRRMGG